MNKKSLAKKEMVWLIAALIVIAFIVLLMLNWKNLMIGGGTNLVEYVFNMLRTGPG